MTLVEEFVSKVSELVEKRTKETLNEVKTDTLKEFDALIDLFLEAGITREDLLKENNEIQTSNKELLEKIVSGLELKESKEETQEETPETESQKTETPEEKQEETTVVESIDLLNKVLTDSNKKEEEELENTEKESNKEAEKRDAVIRNDIQKVDKKVKESNNSILQTIKKWLVAAALIFFLDPIQAITRYIWNDTGLGDKVKQWMSEAFPGLMDSINGIYEMLTGIYGHVVKPISDMTRRIKRALEFKKHIKAGKSTFEELGEYTGGPGYLYSRDEVNRLKNRNNWEGTGLDPWTDAQLWAAEYNEGNSKPDERYNELNTGVMHHFSPEKLQTIRGNFLVLSNSKGSMKSATPYGPVETLRNFYTLAPISLGRYTPKRIQEHMDSIENNTPSTLQLNPQAPQLNPQAPLLFPMGGSDENSTQNQPISANQTTIINNTTIINEHVQDYSLPIT